MKKLLTSCLVAFALAGLVTGPAMAQAQRPQAPLFLQWESLGVAAGAQVQSPVLVMGNSSSGCNELSVVADNSGGAATRALNVDWLGSDGTTILFRASLTVAIAGRGMVVVAQNASAATQPTGVLVVPAQPGLKMQATLAAGGAAAGSLAVYCR